MIQQFYDFTHTVQKPGTKPLTTRMSLGITAEMEKSINSELDGITTYIWLKQSSPMDCTDF